MMKNVYAFSLYYELKRKKQEIKKERKKEKYIWWEGNKQ